MMVTYTPDNVRSVPDPDDVADDLATQLEQIAQVDDEVTERVRTSETPLSVPIRDSLSKTGSLSSILHYCVLNRLKTTEEVSRVSFSKVDVEQGASIVTHPSLLERSNRLLPQTALAKTYQYGYWPGLWRVVEGGFSTDQSETEAGVPYEKRELTLFWHDEYSQDTFEAEDNWFNDTDAVSEFAGRVTNDDVDWTRYIPWYRTTTVSRYQLPRVAHTTDWTEFPEHPDARPKIKDRFDTLQNPRVGDFVRMAVLRKLERHLPVIMNLSTGPDPWETDRVSLVVDPTAANGRPDGAMLCPSVAVKKLAEYGYRPIDGWYDAPAIGYEPDDPTEPRRIEFARGHALQKWYDEIRMNSPLFSEPTQIVDIGSLPDIDWQTFIPYAQSQIITYQQLYDLAHGSETLL
jgi:hypothetical protein